MSDLPMKPSCRRVLERLREGPATTAELLQPDVGGGRFGRSHLYTLVGEPERALSEAKDPAPSIQADPGSVPSQEGVRSAASAESHSLFDASVFAEHGGYRDAERAA